MARFVGAGNVYPAAEWRDCCWPRCMRMAEGGGPPLCQRHINEIVEDYERERIRFYGEVVRETREQKEARFARWQEKRKAELEAQSKVYYVRIGDHVKIGFTVNLHQRLSGLRVPASNLLATEPGGRIKERERHLQFAAERVGRKEDFNPSRRLLAHIASVRAEHGEPTITTYPRVSLDRG